MAVPQKLYKGWVTHVTDPSSFWMQIGTDSDFDLFKVYQASIDGFFNTNGDAFVVSASSLSQGDCVVVLNPLGEESFKWRRARVSRVEEESVDVFYVDYGYTEILNIADVRTITPPFFEYMPPQAIRAGLAGIQPLTRSWTSRAISVFEGQVLNKSVIASLLEVDESQSYVFVELYTRGDDGDWYSITHGMLEDELGLPSEYSFSFEKCIDHDTVEEVLVKTNQHESAESVEESQESQENVNTCVDGREHAGEEVWDDARENHKLEAQAEIRNDTSVKGEGEDAVKEVWDDADENDKVEGQAAQEVWDDASVSDEDKEAAQEVWDDADENDKVEGQAGEEVWDDASVSDEDEEAAQEVWDDAIENLEHSSSEDDTLETNEDKSQKMARFAAKRPTEVEQGQRGSNLSPPVDNAKGASPTRSSQSTGISVGVSQFNIGPLSQTRTVTVREMRVKAEERTQKKRLSALKKDLDRCEEDLQEGLLPNLSWGRSDSQVGEPHHVADSDLQESISEELSSRCLSGVDERKALRQAMSVKLDEPKKNAKSQSPPLNISDRREMTEEESYNVWTRIVEVLQNKRQETPEILRVHVHDIIAPDKTLASDALTAVVTSILESIVENKCQDPAVALTILETYTDVDGFLEVLTCTLKTLKDKRVKLSKCIRNSSTHEAYASVLAMMFIQSQCWSSRICKAVQTYCLNTVERWTIFNKKRVQDQDSTLETELMYLDCVSIFVRQTHGILQTQFPDHFHFWIKEIREKLLHDQTNRCLRVRLLDILLENNGNASGCSQQSFVSSTSVATQTGTSNCLRADDLQKTRECALYKAPKGALYPRDDLFTPHVLPSDSGIEPEKQQSFSSNEDAPSATYDIYCESEPTATDLSHFFPEHSVNLESAEHPQSDFQKEETLFSDFRYPSASPPAENADALKAESNQVDKYNNFLQAERREGAIKNQEDKIEDNLQSFKAKAVPDVKRIRYSSEELKALNPLKGMSKVNVTLTEPYELRHIFCRVKDDFDCNSHVNSTRSHIPSQRYVGTGSPLEVSSSPGCNSDKWGDISDFLSDTMKVHGSSVDYNPGANSSSNNISAISGVIEKPSQESLECFNATNREVDEKNQLSEDKEDWTHGITVSPDKEKADCTVPSEWPDNFFRSTRTNNSSGDLEQLEDIENEEPKQSVQVSKKKKKTKFRPLADFFEEPRTIGVEEAGGESDEFQELDEFSPQALQMYVDLEKQESEIKSAEVKMIHGPRMTSSVSSRTRPSLFADVRKAKSAPTSQPWVPGKRKCTRCGSEKHIVVDCQEGTINDADDMSFMF